MAKEFKVLFCKKITENQLYKVDFEIDECDFIRVKQLAFKIPLPHCKHLIFTSQKAVDAVLSRYEIPTTQSIYVVGKKTRAKLLEYADFHNIKMPSLSHENSAGLIELLESDKSDDFLYLCGKRRLATLEKYLEKSRKIYKIVEVYETELFTPLDLTVEDYTWICFCSPSAVDSYVEKYPILPFHRVLCIGKTTANRLIGVTQNITIAPEASIESMLKYLEQEYEKD